MQQSTRGKLCDSAFLLLVIALSSVPYIRGLGFYSDDWAVFGAFNNTPNQSVAGFFQSFYSPEVAKRPVQIFYYAFLYRLFGLNPIGHHLFNHLIFTIAIILLYLLLRQLKIDRIAALAISVVFALLPHYSTARFWFMSFQVNLCMVLYFLSLYFDLKALNAGGLRTWILKLFSWLAMFGSILAYELFLPLFFLNILLVWFRSKRSSEIARKHVVLLTLSNLFALLFAVALKAFLLGTTHVLMQKPSEHLLWFLKIVLGFARVSYGTYGLLLPLIVKKSISYSGWKTIFVGGLLVLAIFFYLFKVAKVFVEDRLELRRSMTKLVFSGIAVFVTSYTIFLLSENASVTPTGINNRFATAGSIGVAISMVGAIGWIISFSSSTNIRRVAFSVLISFLCGAGFITINAVGKFWIIAYEKETQVLNDIHKNLPKIPAGSTLLLDGVCPYAGPGIVFESNWDLSGALKTLYHYSSLKADIVRPTLKITKEGIRTTLYGEEFIYPYHQLFIYDFRGKKIHALTSSDAARSYFETYDPFFGIDCPDGIEGFGVPIF